MQYFFYGTLCDPDIRQFVLGYRPSPRQLRAAVLTGFRRKQVCGRSYPILVPSPGSKVDGLLFAPARAEDALRLAAYEGPEYLTRALPVRPVGAAGSCRAFVFLPARDATGEPALTPSHGDWRFETWLRRHKTSFLSSLQNQGLFPCANP
ncbi:gamma-glutamylcyclotransferase family protein [uncultured Ferrovibrio sp.]|jgi:AIG2-like family.|uniref:gamma-glutamylcyclotransferase family protein n=1 Tax=uncultured Ferrovibrio sp. TaxID=1576913 RepID=UPI0026085D84|nr:gamma-glutamylcyclotransferase family protein [uncultured Ferrovibrio sp.]